MKEKGEIKSVSSTTVQGGVEMYTYWYKAPDGIYRTQASFQTFVRRYNSRKIFLWPSRYVGYVARGPMVEVEWTIGQRESLKSYQRADTI